MKNDVIVPSKSNKQKKLGKKIFFVGVLKVTDEKGSGSRFVSQKDGSANPDPDMYGTHQNVTDPEH